MVFRSSPNVITLDIHSVDAVETLYNFVTTCSQSLACGYSNVGNFILFIRPDGAKKAYVRLTADYDALDVANKIGII